VWRLAGWLLVLTLALLAHLLDSNVLRVACAFAVLALIAANAPRTLLVPLAVAAGTALAALLLGGSTKLLDCLPALISAFVAWLFARTLLGTRRPLIARAIAALDGEAQLQDAAVVRYARRLTAIWAIYQAMLATMALALAWPAALPTWAPGPRLFGAVILPLAIAALLLGEFALRPRLLPQAPRYRLGPFVIALIRAWPALLAD
jgi:uncharacterized membrane protein